MTPANLDISLRRLRGNLLGNAAHFLVGTGIGVWMTPYLISKLGVATYGLVPLATNITSYMAIVMVSLGDSVGRFLAVDIAGDDTAGANRTFNTSLLASLALAGLLLPVVWGIAWFAPEILDVPPGQEEGTRWLLLAAGMAFLTNAIAGTFGASTFATNRFDLERLVDIIGTLARASCVVALFSLYEPALWHVGVSILLLASVSFIGCITLWRRLTPQIHIRPRDFDRGKLGEILSMGGWVTVNRTGLMLFSKAELLVVNLVLGARPAGLYAPLLQLSLLLRSFVAIASGVLTPTFIAHHVSGDDTRMVTVSRQAVKTMGLAIALPSGLLAGLGQPLLNLWLGEEFAPLWPLLAIITLHLCLNAAVTPIGGIQRALNKVLWPGVVTIIMGVCNVGLAVWLAGPAGWGLYGVAIAGAVAMTAKNVLFLPIYAAHILRCRVAPFLWGLAATITGTVLVAACAWGAAVLFDLNSWPRLIAAGLAIAVVYSVATYYIGFRKSERATLRNLLLQKRSKMQGTRTEETP